MSITVDNFYIRKSCRKFLPKPIPKELVNKLVVAGRKAPSGSNCQPWKFYVVTNQTVNQKIATAGHAVCKEKLPAFTEVAEKNGVETIFFGAPLVIYITCQKNLLERRTFDLGLAAQNILIAAQAVGLATIPVASPRYHALNVVLEQLKIPDTEVFYVAIAVGYADPNPVADYTTVVPTFGSRKTDNAVFIESSIQTSPPGEAKPITATIDNFFGRRSCRKYLNTPVPRVLLEKLVEVARNSPSGSNSQPWKFYVVTDPAINQKVASEGTAQAKVHNPEFAGHAEENGVDCIFFNAPAVIYITYRVDAFESKIFDLGLATENILVGAYLLGLDSIPVASPRMFVPEVVKKVLSIPDTEVFQIAVAVGFGDNNIVYDYYKGNPSLATRNEDNAVYIE